MNTISIFDGLLEQAKALQMENDKQAPVRYWTDTNPQPLDDVQPIPGEDLALIHELLSITSARATAIVAAMQAREIPRAGAVEQLEPLRLLLGYLGERLQRCTIQNRSEGTQEAQAPTAPVVVKLKASAI